MRLSPPPPRPHAGFTTVELMIVVLLIGILVAIVLPMHNNYRQRLKTQQAITDIVAMSTLIKVHANEARAFPEDLAGVGLAGRFDPWGRPYRYYNVEAHGRGHARKDKALNPINSDFDLYSMGPDGKTKPQVSQKDSVDDILRAGNGRFIGIAADF